MSAPLRPSPLLPVWLQAYQRGWLAGDLTAGVIVTVMLIPQSLAYAMLAGLPPQIGLYASIAPLVAYALFGSSMTLAVGPVAVVSLMTASALAPLAAAGSAAYLGLAVQLALLSGVMLFVFGLLRLGALAHLLSHPVINGFISGSAVLIAIGQLKHIFGIPVTATGVVQTVQQLVRGAPQLNLTTTGIGLGALGLLAFSRAALPRILRQLGVSAGAAGLCAKLAPMLAVVLGTVAVTLGQWHLTAGVKVVGQVPAGLPALAVVWPDSQSLSMLWLPALLIAVVGFVESVSVAHSLALKRQQRIIPDKELLGLGAANVASAVCGGFPVTGGFARSVVNFAAGANTPLAGVVSAGLMAVVLAGLTDWFTLLPQAVLAATIIIAVTSLIDFDTLKQVWDYDRADAVSLLVTVLGVVVLGVEEGILLGVVLSLGVLVWRSSHPHMAVVGRVAGTEHFRNVSRHAVETLPDVIALRIDESLFFGNAAAVESRIMQLVDHQPSIRGLLLILSAVNRIDTTALGVLDDLQRSLGERGVVLSLAEVKGPVMDKLATTPLGKRLAGQVFLSTHEAFCALSAAEKPPAAAG